MKVLFQETDRSKVLADIKSALGDRKLSEMVSFAMTTGNLEVTISKFGTSTLQFSEKPVANGLEYSLANEKIAFAHKAFKDEVTQKILRVIEKAGGKVVQA
jgi:hypothetical protein